ncbi:MAG: methylmalonyl Co-A mutase-associated GTPase MeaB [Myxococcales bacterium]|nr:methylmalonyl Co-A mutase-associated GTPase MeaB [Myxococcales bacterium]
MQAAELKAIAEGVRRAEKGAVARALNLVEDRRAGSREAIGALLAQLEPKAGGQRIGLTGPPGVGKSCLGAALARALRARDRSVGLVAIDPTSLRSGGSLLGDRARMGFDPADAGLFVRSLATGGQPGGLSYAANASARVLGAAYDRVLIETTGVGQTETDVADLADTVVLVIQPGSGDALQFLKAGIMEIPDLLVVNKADLGAIAERACAELRSAIGLQRSIDAAEPTPLLSVSAADGRGIPALLDALEAHRRALEPKLRARRREGDLAWILSLFARRHGEFGLETLGGRAAIRGEASALMDAGRSPMQAATALAEAFLERAGLSGR